nr:hypothetical protein [Tanacetum cinerariifolium]
MSTALAGSYGAKAYGANNGVVGAENFWAATMARSHGSVVPLPLKDVDASVFLLVVPWHNNKTLRKDPHPTPDEFDLNVCDYLADNPTPFRKLPEPFLCFVSISVKWEREVAEEEVQLLQLTRGRVVPLAGVNDQEDANVQGAGEDNMNEGVMMLRCLIRFRRVIMLFKMKGADFVRIEDEVPTVAAEKPKV